MRDPTRMRGETYRYGAGTHAHPRALFRHSHGRRFRAAAQLLNPRPEHRVLDYGSGDGYFLELLARGSGPPAAGESRAAIPPENLTGLEPMEILQDQFRERLGGMPVRLAAVSGDLPSSSFDRIACLEVLEHLRPGAFARTLDELERLLAPGGVLVVSVPLEVGLSVLAKYTAALLLTRMDRWYAFSEVVRATLGLRVERDAEGEFLSHKGYDHRTTRGVLRERFRIDRTVYTPFAALGPLLNSQVTWRLRRASDEHPA